jgi:hypothetical protein
MCNKKLKTHTLSGRVMDEKGVLKKFGQQKIITIEQLVQLFQCSVITVRRRLKKWKTYTSINKNGRYYTLPQIPVFDENGLWKYQTVLFSKYGNLKQTIIELIRRSQAGLSAVDIAKIIEIRSSSSIFSQIKNVAGIKREKHEGRFIYFSDTADNYQWQKRALGRQKVADWPTDAQAVEILIQMIKHPGINIEQLGVKAASQGKRFDSATIRRFLQFHDLLKKTSDTKL